MKRRLQKDKLQPYSISAQYYDLLAQYIDFNEIVDYLEEILFYKEISPKKVLDLGCGTGIASLIMSEKGYSVTGVDCSIDMLDVAKNKAAEKKIKIPFIQAKMEEFKKDDEFDLVISLSDCINHLIPHKLVQKTFRNVYDSLTDGGIFIFDINTPYELEHVMSVEQEEIIGSLKYTWSGYFDHKVGIGTFIQSFYSLENGQEVFIGKEVHKEQAYKPREIRIWLKDAGFKNIEYYEAFTREKPDKVNIERIYFVAEKHV
ncbi:MAG: hypothetical protein DKM50_06105 [Candidatus Margulisiibacteriota bacterium]|nr:MAG: hypothetical protein A2X43_10250 [Candidatus Margulisbacteria bacterium GWD2_39_127]OGI05438.1 MAG: hypothetical protein A2X42_09260 [Candidatus Margulisbacteria bacterium GWF2_38_17]OGI07824.1 MAG: hypothetical protein A2X41_11895 [Candidatus Margulisbacteria bacterium GWE2_39_32]PZM80120.1 MAG: hypothetical protein DKM50_06105 [Candidatus Margulisiibacteriota bacterium]HAR62614.1 hypothetical protein [Candidatus Margulisiibacteriota bacterium]